MKIGLNPKLNRTKEKTFYFIFQKCLTISYRRWFETWSEKDKADARWWYHKLNKLMGKISTDQIKSDKSCNLNLLRYFVRNQKMIYRPAPRLGIFPWQPVCVSSQTPNWIFKGGRRPAVKSDLLILCSKTLIFWNETCFRYETWQALLVPEVLNYYAIMKKFRIFSSDNLTME